MPFEFRATVCSFPSEKSRSSNFFKSITASRSVSDLMPSISGKGNLSTTMAVQGIVRLANRSFTTVFPRVSTLVLPTASRWAVCRVSMEVARSLLIMFCSDPVSMIIVFAAPFIAAFVVNTLWRLVYCSSEDRASLAAIDFALFRLGNLCFWHSKLLPNVLVYHSYNTLVDHPVCGLAACYEFVL